MYSFRIAGMEHALATDACSDDREATAFALKTIRQITTLLPPEVYHGAVVEVIDPAGRVIDRLPLARVQ